MIGYIKNHKLALVLAGIALFTILRIMIPFYGGYSGNFLDIFLLCTEAIRYTLLVSFIIVTVVSTINRQQKILFTLVWVFLFSVGLIPTGEFMTLGALLSIHNADPEQIRDDARILMDEYEPNTHFSNDNNQRYLFNNPIPKNRLPSSLQNENINDILVLEDYVFFEKFGLSGLFRGFIVFREGSDIWKDEQAITLLDGCSYCWRIRVLDGLYWYHAVPTEEEIATVTFPLK